MAIPAVLTAVSGVSSMLNAVKSLGVKTPEGEVTVGDVINATKDIKDSANVSLFSFAKKSMIISRIYIDETVASEPIMTDVVKTTHNLFAALVLNALQMNNYVTGGKTIESMIKVVATESLTKEHVSSIAAFEAMNTTYKTKIKLNRNVFSLEDLKEDEFKYKQQKDAVDYIIDHSKDAYKRNKDEQDRTHQDNRDKTQDEKDRLAQKSRQQDTMLKIMDLENKNKQTPYGTKGQVVSLAGDNHIPAGKVIEVTLQNPDNHHANVTINLLVQMSPYIMPIRVAIEAIKLNVVHTFMQRYLQWKTGEISFWGDLVFNMDVIRDRNKAMRQDSTGILSEMAKQQTKNRGKAYANIAYKQADRSRNLANAVMVFSGDAAKLAQAESGFTFENKEMRDDFFAKSFTMMIIIVDTMYNTVTMYYNGLDTVSTFTFDQMKTSAKGGGNLDIVSVLNALNQGKAPKF